VNKTTHRSHARNGVLGTMLQDGSQCIYERCSSSRPLSHFKREDGQQLFISISLWKRWFPQQEWILLMMLMP